MTRPNRDLDQAGHTLRHKPDRKLHTTGQALADYTAYDVTKAQEHLHKQLTICDGHLERGDQVAVSSSGTTSSTEAAMLARTRITDARDKIDTSITEVFDAINRLAWALRAAMRINAPQDVVQPSKAKLCMDGLTDATRPGSMEWHDPTCRAAPTTRGLCTKHYNAMYYWRRTHGMDPVPESDLPQVPGLIRSSAEVLVRDGELGAAHAYPARDPSHGFKIDA